MNQEIISQINTIEEELNEYTETYSDNLRTNFNLSDLNFHEGAGIIGDTFLSKTALKQLMSLFQVKDKFVSSQNAQILGPTEIASFINTIKGVNLGNRLFCSYDDITNPKEIKNIWLSSDAREGAFPDYQVYLNNVKEKLNETEIDFTLDNINFDKPTGSISLSLLTEDTINVGSNNTNNIDEWRNGLYLDFNLFTTTAAPFYSRLICSNGMISREYMKRMNLNHSKYNQNKLDALTKRFLIDGDFRETEEMLYEKCTIANDTPISILEFEYARQLLSSQLLEVNEDSSEKFDITSVEDAYGVDLNEQSKKWKATARVNKSVYEVVNDLTWIAARPSEYDITQKEAEQIQLGSSSLLLKKRYDMEEIAPNPYSNN